MQHEGTSRVAGGGGGRAGGEGQCNGMSSNVKGDRGGLTVADTACVRTPRHHHACVQAKTIRTTQSVVPLDVVLGTSLFDMEAAQTSAGWIKELESEHVPETEEYGNFDIILIHLSRASQPSHLPRAVPSSTW